MDKFIEQHRSAIVGTLSGFDRLILRGTLRGLEYVDGMLGFLGACGVLLKCFASFVQDFTERVKAASLAVAQRAGRPVVHLSSPHTRKDEVARAIATRERITKGLVCVLSAVEPCLAYDVRANHKTKHLDLVRRSRKCLFLYHYQIHPLFGFMHARLQTWFPFAMQVWINGREWLSRQLDAHGLEYRRRDNCFPWIADLERAQKLMDRQLCFAWPHHLEAIARKTNPLYPHIFEPSYAAYYWSVQDSEWATDVLFRRQDQLAALYPQLLHHALTTCATRDVLRFLGRRVPETGYRIGPATEVTSDLGQRFEGLRLKHRVGLNSLKLYDKQGTVLRTETTIRHPRDFKVFRPMEGDPRGPCALRPLRRGIADLRRRAEVSQAANERYLDALASADTHTPLGELTRCLCRPTTWRGHRVRALNPWAPQDARLLEAVSSGDFLLHGFRNRDLRAVLFPASASGADPKRQAAAVTRQIRMLRAHGLVRKLGASHRYRLTEKGRVIITALLTARQTSAEALMPKAA